MKNFLPAAMILFSVVISGLAEDVPNIIAHQGRIAVDGVNFNGDGQFLFSMVNADGSEIFWRNSASSTAVSLAVKDGVYSVSLGDTNVANMAEIPYSVFDNDEVYLRIAFNDGASGWQTLSPDQRIAAVGYSMRAAGLSGYVQTTDDGDLMVNGDLGVGTSSPDYPLEVMSSGNSSVYVEKQTDVAGEQVHSCLFVKSRSSAGDRSSLRFRHGDKTVAKVYSISDGDSRGSLNLETRTDSNINFLTDGAQTMSVQSSGRVGINTDEPDSKLHVNGTVTAVSYVTTSDARLKTNIRPIEEPMQIVRGLKGVKFDFINETDANDTPDHVGFLAQDVERVLPEVVKDGDSGYKAVSYQNITAVLVEAMKSQQTLIESQQRELESLRQRLEILEGRGE